MIQISLVSIATSVSESEWEIMRSAGADVAQSRSTQRISACYEPKTQVQTRPHSHTLIRYLLQLGQDEVATFLHI